MKHLYFLTIGLLSAAAAISAEARVSGVSVPGPYPHTPSQSSSSAASVSVNTRLIAKSYYLYQNGQFTPVDSFGYTYSSSRGGSPDEMDINDDGVMFDESTQYIYNGSAFVNKLKRTQYYGVNNRIEWLYYNPWKASAQSWKDSVRYAYLYTGAGSQIMHARLDIYSGIGQYPWNNGNNYLYNNSYTPSGFIDGIFTDDKHIFFVYDANDNLVCRWMEIRNTNSAQWYATIKDSFTYDAAGRVNYVLHQTYNVSSYSWTNNLQTFYTYVNATDNDIAFSLVEEWNAATSAWQKKEKHLFNFDNNHNKTADITQSWNAGQGAYANTSRIDWTYNYNHQVTSITTTTWVGSNWAPIAGDYHRYFYYENYFKVGIDQPDAVVNMDLFPSPAQDAVHFRIDWRTPQAFTMQVTDMQGRTLQQWNENATASYERTLDVTQWPAGNYLLTVNGTRGQATRRFVVAR